MFRRAASGVRSSAQPDRILCESTTVVVTFAVRSELAPWLRLRSFRRVALDGSTSYQTTIGRADVHVILTGIGSFHAKQAIQAVLAMRPDAVVASGLAGGLRSTYAAGDVLAARLVGSDRSDQRVSSNEELVNIAIACGAKAVGSFISADAMARTVEEKSVLGAIADAVDMESFTVLTEAKAAGIPAIALRSVADTSDRDLPCDFSKMVNERGQMQMGRLALEPFCAPRRLPALVQFGLASRRAASQLAQFLDRYIEVVAEK